MAVDVTGVSELVLEVVDLQASERFYADVLGLPVVERWPDREAIWVMAGERTRIGLWRPQVGLFGGRGGIHVHLGMLAHYRPVRVAAIQRSSACCNAVPLRPKGMVNRPVELRPRARARRRERTALNAQGSSDAAASCVNVLQCTATPYPCARRPVAAAR